MCCNSSGTIEIGVLRRLFNFRVLPVAVQFSSTHIAKQVAGSRGFVEDVDLLGWFIRRLLRPLPNIECIGPATAGMACKIGQYDILRRIHRDRFRAGDAG